MPHGNLPAVLGAQYSARGHAQTYVYNDAGERTYTVDNFGHITAYAYDADGWLTGVSYPLSNDLVVSALREQIAFGLVATDATGKGKWNDGLAFLKTLGVGRTEEFDAPLMSVAAISPKKVAAIPQRVGYEFVRQKGIECMPRRQDRQEWPRLVSITAAFQSTG